MKTHQNQEERAAKKLAWKNHIESWKSSDTKVTDFCKSNALNYHQFKYWQQIFNRDQHPDAGNSDYPCEFIEITSLENNSLVAPMIDNTNGHA